MWRDKADRSQRTANAVGILLDSHHSGARCSGSAGLRGKPASGLNGQPRRSRTDRPTDPQPRGHTVPHPRVSPPALRSAAPLPIPVRFSCSGAAPRSPGDSLRPRMTAPPLRTPQGALSPARARRAAALPAERTEGNFPLAAPSPPHGAAASHGRGAAPALTMPGGGPASLRRTSPAAPRPLRPARSPPPPGSAPHRPRPPTCPQARPRCARLGARLALPLAPEGGQPLETAYLRFPAAALIDLFLLLPPPLSPVSARVSHPGTTRRPPYKFMF